MPPWRRMASASPPCADRCRRLRALNRFDLPEPLGPMRTLSLPGSQDTSRKERNPLIWSRWIIPAFYCTPPTPSPAAAPRAGPLPSATETSFETPFSSMVTP